VDTSGKVAYIKIQSFAGGRLSHILPHFLNSSSQSNGRATQGGRIKPPIYILLLYAEAANICSDVLLDDSYDPPDEIPAKIKTPQTSDRTYNAVISQGFENRSSLVNLLRDGLSD
jgi:hypothetical protein